MFTSLGFFSVQYALHHALICIPPLWQNLKKHKIIFDAPCLFCSFTTSVFNFVMFFNSLFFPASPTPSHAHSSFFIPFKNIKHPCSLSSLLSPTTVLSTRKLCPLPPSKLHLKWPPVPFLVPPPQTDAHTSYAVPKRWLPPSNETVTQTLHSYLHPFQQHKLSTDSSPTPPCPQTSSHWTAYYLTASAPQRNFLLLALVTSI